MYKMIHRGSLNYFPLNNLSASNKNLDFVSFSLSHFTGYFMNRQMTLCVIKNVYALWKRIRHNLNRLVTLPAVDISNQFTHSLNPTLYLHQ